MSHFIVITTHHLAYSQRCLHRSIADRSLSADSPDISSSVYYFLKSTKVAIDRRSDVDRRRLGTLFETEEQATKVRTITDWSRAVQDDLGVVLYKRNYGIVIHGVALISLDSMKMTDMYCERILYRSSTLCKCRGLLPSIPNYPVFQCDYGHHAAQCKRHARCGKCSEKHNTKECTSTELKCAQCSEAHCWNKCELLNY